MDRKITYSFLALAFATLACNYVTGRQLATSVPVSAASTELSFPSDLTEPYVTGVLWDLVYSPDRSPMSTTYGDFPYTRLPSDANIVAVSLFLELPQGWPEHKTELRTQWFRNGAPVEGSEGSLVCTQQEPCKVYTSRRYSSTGFDDGRYEVRLYLGDKLLDGIEAKVELTSAEWVGDLYVLQCDDVTSDTCTNAQSQPKIFSKHAIFPSGTQIVKIVNAFTLLPSGASWQVDVYRDDRLIASETQTVTGAGQWSGWRVTSLSAPGGAFGPGLYFVKLTWEGVLQEMVSFEIQ